MSIRYTCNSVSGRPMPGLPNPTLLPNRLADSWQHGGKARDQHDYEPGGTGVYSRQGIPKAGALQGHPALRLFVAR